MGSVENQKFLASEYDSTFNFTNQIDKNQNLQHLQLIAVLFITKKMFKNVRLK